MEEMTLATLWTAISTVVTQLMSTVASVGEAVLSNILFQTVFGIGIAYTAVILFRKLTNI